MSAIMNKVMATVSDVASLKDSATTKLSELSGVDVLIGAIDLIDKLNESIDKIPLYRTVEESAQGVFSTHPDEMLNTSIFVNVINSANMLYLVASDKLTGVGLADGSVKKSARITSVLLATSYATFTLLSLIEKRRRLNEPKANVNEVVEVFADQNPNELQRLFGVDGK